MPLGRWKLRLGTLFLVLLAATPGCGFLELSENLKVIDQAGQVNIYVDPDRFGDHPVIAALVRESADMSVTVETFGVVPHHAPLTLLAEPGEYLLVAVQDLNGNQKHDAGEPYALYGEPTPIELWDGRVIDRIDLKLTVSVLPDHWQPRDMQDRGVTLNPRLAEFGQVVSLDDPRFEREIARMGMWQPADFIQANHPGLFMIEAYDPDKTPVLFVHGIGGSPRHFATVIEQMDRDRFQPWVLYYPSALRLELLGGYLQIALDRMRSAHRFDRVYLVSHSMGGLVAWAGVRAHLRSVETPYIELLVTIHSPLGGMQSAAAGVDKAPVVMPSWIDLDPRSEFVASIYEAALPETLPYFLIYGVGENEAFPLPLPEAMLDESLITFDGQEITDETVTLDSQLHRPAVARAQSIYGDRATHMGTLTTPQTIDTLNQILADRADAADALRVSSETTSSQSQ